MNLTLVVTYKVEHIGNTAIFKYVLVVNGEYVTTSATIQLGYDGFTKHLTKYAISWTGLTAREISTVTIVDTLINF